MDDKLSYASPADVTTPTDPIAWDTSSAPPPLPDSILGARAQRADFALGDKSPGPQVLKDSFRAGGEPQVRQSAAADADIQFRQDKLDQIKKMASLGTPVTDTEVNGIMAVGKTPNANPDTVLEDKFAKNMVNYGVIGDPGTNLVFQSAFDAHPDETRDGVMIAQASVSKQHQARGLLEEAQAAYDQIPWINTSEAGKDQQDKLGDFAKGIFSAGIATYVNQRNLLNSAPTNSFLPGSNKLEQIQYLYLLGDKFLPTLRAAAGPDSPLWKESPSAAMDFIKSAVQFSTSDAYVDNVYGIANVAGILPVGTALKALGRFRNGKLVEDVGVQTLDTALKNARSVLNESPASPKVQPTEAGKGAAQAAQDVLNASPKSPIGSKYYIPEAAVKRPWETEPRLGEIRLKPGETPQIFTQDGAQVAVSKLPREGSLPFEVTPGTPKTTFRTSRGSTYEVADDGTTVRNRAEGKGNPESKTQADTGNGGIQPASERTVYVDGDQLNRLSAMQAKDGKKRALDFDEKGRLGIINLDGPRIGKFDRNSMVKHSTEPAKGLYPVETWDNGEKVHFGNKITSVETNTAPGVKFGPKIVTPAEIETRTALADIVKSQAESHPQDVLSKMGQHENAATIGATEQLQDKLNQITHTGDVEAIRRNVPSLASPQTFFNNSSSLTRERADRLAREAAQSSVQLMDAIANPVRVERMTQQALDQAVSIAKSQVRNRYNRAADAILDQADHWDGASNTYFIETKFGKKDGTLFDSSVSANHYRTFQYRLGDSATVKQEGNQFYISHIQHADEAQTGVRNSLIVTGNETPRGWWNSLVTALTGKFAPFGSSLRSSAYTVSPFQMNNRVVATHAPSIMREAIETTAKDLEALGGRWTTNERHEMQQILEHNRDFMTPDGKRGEFYKSALEFETAFNNLHGKMPTEKQIKAYDQFTRLSDLDWTLRELDWQRDKARLGIRNYRVAFKGQDELGMPSTAKTEYFNGKLVKDFDPVNTQDANIYVMGRNEFHTKHDFPKEVMDKIKAGELQIIQVYNPRQKPLMATTGVKDDIHFVVTDKFEDKAIQWGTHSEYRPGGHVIYQDQFYLKQPMIGPGSKGRDTHFGDKSIKAFATEKEANEWAVKYNTAREFLHAGDEAGLQAYINAGHLPETLPDFKKLFTGGGADLSTAHPIVVTHAGRDTFQSSEALARQYPGLKDQFTSYNLAQVQDSKFLADRGQQLSTVANTGTEVNPIYTNVPSRLMDPYTALQKGMAQIVRSRWMSDYKISAAESWVQEFGLLFDQSKLPIEKLRQNPTYWLYHAEGNIDAGVMKTNPELVTAAMTSRKNIMNFLGSRDEVGAVLEGLEKKLVNGIGGIFGDKMALRAEETFLPAIKDAPAYARKSAFNAVIGLFNPAQLFQQSQGMAHVVALSPINGIKGVTASVLARLYRYTENPAILDSMADKAAAMGWNRDHFVEAYQAWKNSGTHAIGGETALLSTSADPKLFQNAGQKFLDKGQMFFKAGESIVRDTSWFTAHLDWRQTNPNRVLDNRAMGEISRRFDTLSLNMTRASNAAYNEGILSIPTQFWTWNARFTEQMIGKQLTLGEKARAVTMYSALYGVPATLGGITFGAIPYANYGDIRQAALANNVNVHEKWYQAFSEGLPTILLNAITGHDNDLQRFSPNATQLKDIIDGKKSAMEALGGASGGFVAQVAKTVWPAMMYGFSAVKKDSGFPLKGNDLVNLAENVSSFNSGEKAVIGWNLGKYMSKTEGFVTEVDKYESVLMALGINPKRVNDAYSKLDYLKHLEEGQKSLQKKMTEDWKLGMNAASRGDYQTMVDYMQRVQSWSAAGNFTKEQEVDIFKQAMRGNESLVDSANKRWMQDLPQLQSIPALRTYLENNK